MTTAIETTSLFTKTYNVELVGFESKDIVVTASNDRSDVYKGEYTVVSYYDEVKATDIELVCEDTDYFVENDEFVIESALFEIARRNGYREIRITRA